MQYDIKQILNTKKIKATLIFISYTVGVLFFFFAGFIESEPDNLKKTQIKKQKIEAVGERGKEFKKEYKELRKQKSSKFFRWKMKLPFWERKRIIIIELLFLITIGVIIGQILEVSGYVNIFAFITYPILKLGNLPKSTSPPFLMAFQSGAVANSMLANSRDLGKISSRHLYTSIFVVSCISLLAHLPTYIIPLGAAFGTEATVAFFAVRFSAIFIEIIFILLVSNFLAKFFIKDELIVNEKIAEILEQKHGKDDLSFWKKVYKRSYRSLHRLYIFIVPTFLFMAWLERTGTIEKVTKVLPSNIPFLPPEAITVVAAYAVNLYNGAIQAANLIDDGHIDTRQAIIILLISSILTAPWRSMRYALPVYVSVLGPLKGGIMAISTQALRVIFVLLHTVLLMWLWKM